MFLSKSDYIIGLDCLKQLWLKKNRKDLEPEYDERTLQNFATGDKVQDLARDYYPGGVLVDAETWDVFGGAVKTKEAAKSHDVLYEATAVLDNGCFCRIDVLVKNGTAWDLIEIKSAAKVQNYYIDDLAFQKYVFENAGYPVINCKVLYINNKYVRHGELDIRQLFTEEDVSERVNAKKNEVEGFVKGMLSYQEMPEEPEIPPHSGCTDCPYYTYCCKDVPEYSVFDLLSSKKADLFYNQTKSFNVEDVSEDWCTSDTQLIDRAAYLNKDLHVEPENIQEWLNTLEYPLYYLDYETVQCAIPMFDGARPYEQIPFQFSLHIQEAPGAELKHVEFLHQERSDPRRAIAEALVKNCGKKGSVLAYYCAFERDRNSELAELFPDLAADIEAINERVVDQWKPFKNRFLYSYKQNGSASIKHVLPAFSDLSYKGMNIANGGVAMSKYLAFLEGKQTDEENKQMFADLLKYCGQDTYAMVLLMDVLYKFAKGE